jgi:hypothetical protein
MGLTLREGDREYFYGKLDKYFPGLRLRYQNEYGNDYREHLKTSVFRCLPFKNVCFVPRRGRNYKTQFVFGHGEK